MKLLNIHTARAIWLFPLADFNPTGLAIPQEGFDKIGQRYKFEVVPTVVAAIEARKKNEPVHFISGAFPSRSGKDIVVDLKIYTDGLIGESRSNTADTDAFLRDFFDWAPTALGLPKLDVPIRKTMYVSEMYVETDQEMTALNPGLDKFCRLLGSAVPSGSSKSYELFGLHFSTDPKDGPPLVNFKFERQVNTHFSHHRYFSAAPIHTDHHLELLQNLEKLLAG
jgi:hypothetical protein